MSRIQTWLERRWYGGVAPEWPLRLLAAVFARVTRWRRAAYARNAAKLEPIGAPVIVVGNISVGGAGKTPLTAALVQSLRDRGWKPGIVSRGYGGSERGPVLLPEAGDPARFGDETVMLKAITGVPVAVARRRIEGARLLAATGCTVIVADDGLQHYALPRTLEIAVVDARRRYGNGRLLPAGPLREPIERLQRCDFRVLHGDARAEAGWVPMRLELGGLTALHDGSEKSLVWLKGQAVHAVAGIADPARFFSALERAELMVTAHPFPDHHRYSPDDFAFDDGRPLLFTAKDAVKLRGFAKPHWYAVAARAVLPDSFFDAVEQRLKPALNEPPT